MEVDVKGTIGLSSAECSACRFLQVGLSSTCPTPQFILSAQPAGGGAAGHWASVPLWLTGLVCGVGVAKVGIRVKGSPDVGIKWAEVSFTGSSSGGWKS